MNMGVRVNNNHVPHGEKNKRKHIPALRLIIIIAAAALALGALILANSIDFDKLFAKLFTPKPLAGDSTPQNIEFAPIDYDENIFENEAYMAQNRLIRYTDGPLSTIIADGNYALYGDAVVLLHNYLEAVIAGDAKALPELFTDDYKKNNKLPAKFTMQKIYDIEIEFYSQNIINKGKINEVTRCEYIIRYNIMENNGTFRSDVGSGAAVPEIFEVLIDYSRDLTQINSITKIKRAAS